MVFLSVCTVSCVNDRPLVLSENTQRVCDTLQQKIWSGPTVNPPQEADKILRSVIENSGALGSRERWQCAQSIAHDAHQILLEEQADTKKTHDLVVVGAGPHTALFLRVFDQAREFSRTASVLTIEAKPVLAEHFFSLGYRLNSPLPLTSLPAAPVGLSAYVMRDFAPVFTLEPKPVFDAHSFPPETLGSRVTTRLTLFPIAQDLWAQTVLSHFFSPSSFVIGKKAQRIRPVEDGYEIEMEDGRDVRAKTIVLATGLGSAKNLPTPNEPQNQEWAREQQRLAKHCESPNCLPRVMTFDDLLRLNRVFKNNEHNLLNEFNRKRVAVIGAGDAANAIVELLYGEAPRVAYDEEQPREYPRKLLWFGQRYTTYPRFFEQAKPRYRNFFFQNLFQHKRVIQKADPGADATNLTRAPRESLEQQVDFVATPNQIVHVSRGVAGNGAQLTDSDGKIYHIDYVIVATGYKNQLLDLFGCSICQKKDPRAIFQPLPCSIGSPMAYQLVHEGQAEEIYLMGTAALALDGFVTQRDLETSVTQNAASFDILAPKTSAFARYLSKRLP
ncbi:MAG: hypothetical protein AAF471_00310 [Myxococcota bacterium]